MSKNLKNPYFEGCLPIKFSKNQNLQNHTYQLYIILLRSALNSFDIFSVAPSIVINKLFND